MQIPNKRLNGGFTLITVLVMLVAISLLGVTSYTVVTSSSRSAATWSDRQRSLGLTESALKVAEEEIQGWVTAGTFPPAGVAYYKNRSNVTTVSPLPADGVRSVTIESGNNKVASGEVKYMIVYEGKAALRDRITVYAQSAGARDKTNSVVSATYEIGE